MTKKLYTFQALLQMVRTNKKVLHQTLFLLVTQGLAAALSIGVKSIQTQALGVELFGTFTFFLTTLHFVALFVKLGFFSSLRIIIANTHDATEEREWFGVSFVISIAISLIYACFLFAMSAYIDAMFSSQIGPLLRQFFPLLGVMTTYAMFKSITTASNRVRLFGYADVCISIFHVGLLWTLHMVGNLTINTIIFSFLSSISIGLAVGFIRLKPSFKQFNTHLRTLWAQNKAYGLKMFAGQLADQSTYKLDGLLIAYYVNAATLGLYSLALALTRPIAMISLAFNQSYFKFLASKPRLSKRLLTLMALGNLSVLAGIMFISEPLVRYLFGSEFTSLTAYILPLGLAAVINCWYSPLKNFINIRKKGNYALISSLGMAAVNIVGNVIFIPLYGALGAAWVSLVSVISFGLFSIYFYFRTLNEV